jgi:PPP family 3-phenylpropionic acid transporter
VAALRILFLASGSALGFVFPFMALILFERGFDVVGVGLIAGVSAAVSTVALPVYGHVADVVIGRRRALQIAAIVGIGAFAITGAPLAGLLLSLCVVVFWVASTSFNPLVDALAVNALRDPQRDYASLKLLSSLGFASGTVGAGLLYQQAGYDLSVVLYAAAALVVIGAAIPAPDVRRTELQPDAAGGERASVAPSSGRFGSVGLALRTAPRLPGALLAIGLVHLTIITAFTFLTVRLDELGGGPTAVALATGAAAFVEVPAFFLAGRLARRMSLAAMFLVGSAIYSSVVLTWVVMDQPVIIVASRAVTGIGYALFHTASVVTIARLLPRHLQATGQLLFQMVSGGLAALVASAGGGILYAAGGAALVFGLAGAIGLVGAAVGWFVLRPADAANQPVRR